MRIYAHRRLRENQERPSLNISIGSLDLFERRLLADAPHVPVQYVSEIYLFDEFMKFAPTLLLLGFFYFSFRNAAASAGGGGAAGGRDPFSFGKMQRAKVNKETMTKVAFNQVAGMDEAKREITEFVSFLKEPERFRKVGAKVPHGAILMGPPGTGKTLLAKAVAGESQVPFFSISGSDFMEMFVGVGAARVRDLFKQARASAPCIVYIDEIDAIGKPRHGSGSAGRFGGGGHDERETTLNQLLVEMDGFTANQGIVVIASTNVPREGLDRALLRPGRFDRIVYIDKPELSERIEIYKVHLSHLVLQTAPPSAGMDALADRLARLTPGFVGADIANVCNEGALIAARRKAVAVELKDLEAAIDRVVGGLEKRTRVLSPEEKKIVAHHEAGHAVVSWFLPWCDPLLKVTIIPRGNAALGYAQYLPSYETGEDLRYIRTESQMLDSMCMALGGRAAEQMIFRHLSSGAQDDLRRVTDLAYMQVSQLGFAKSLKAPLSFPSSGADMFLQSQPQQPRPASSAYCSEATAAMLDGDVRNMVNAAMQRTLDLLQEKRQELERVAAYLLEHEVMHGDDMRRLCGVPAARDVRLLSSKTTGDVASGKEPGPAEGSEPLAL